jgi:hypothetical protein
MTMRFLVMVPGDKDTEAGVMPTQQQLEEMMQYNEQLVKAGIMLAGEGLQPTSRGARIRFSEGGRKTVIDGPFTESKELIAGFWIWQVKSKEEAIEWAKRAPFPAGTQLELRQIFETADFGDAATPELLAKEEELRKRSEQLTRSGAKR